MAEKSITKNFAKIIKKSFVKAELERYENTHSMNKEDTIKLSNGKKVKVKELIDAYEELFDKKYT